MPKGDIVLITFPFTDLSGTKLRPAVILAEARMDLTVAFVTTQFGWREDTDLELEPSPSNCLRKRSLLRTGKIATLNRTLAKGLLGRLGGKESAELNDKLRLLFGL